MKETIRKYDIIDGEGNRIYQVEINGKIQGSTDENYLGLKMDTLAYTKNLDRESMYYEEIK
jgi:hypothetical protein